VPKSPTGIIPQEFNHQRNLKDVIKFLQDFPCDPQDKEELLFGWARNVGLKLRTSDYNQVLHVGLNT